jgi:hypothetical protein
MSVAENSAAKAVAFCCHPELKYLRVLKFGRKLPTMAFRRARYVIDPLSRHEASDLSELTPPQARLVSRSFQTTIGPSAPTAN